MRELLTAIAVAVLAAAPAKAERWVTYADFHAEMYTREYAESLRMSGKCAYNQIDLDSVTRNGDIATFNDRLFYCERPNSSKVDIGDRVNCATGQRWDKAKKKWGTPVQELKFHRAMFLRRLELVCQ